MERLVGDVTNRRRIVSKSLTLYRYARRYGREAKEVLRRTGAVERSESGRRELLSCVDLLGELLSDGSLLNSSRAIVGLRLGQLLGDQEREENRIETEEYSRCRRWVACRLIRAIRRIR